MVIYTKEEKRIIIPEGLGGYVTGDCRAIAEEAREQGYESGYTQGYNDGVLADCGEAIEEAFNDGFESGYTQGQADCPECSGGTCNLRNGRVELYRDWDGDDTIYPGEGYDGFSSIQITDNGYGNKMYQSGYTQGYNDGQGGGCNLQDKSVYQNSNLVTYYPDEGYNGMRSIYVDATGAYSNGHTDGQNYARSLMVSSAFTENGTYTRAEGWNSVTINVQQSDCSSAVTEAYQSGYTEGYNQGQADCPQCSGGTCNLTDTWIDLMNGDDFEGQGVDYYVSAITPNYDGWYKVHIQDKDYGSSKYQEGYADGQASCPECDCSSAVTEAYQSGYTEGYQSGSTDGYTDGFNDGYLSGASDTCGNAVNEAYELGYQSGTTDGFNDGHSSGYTDGYDAGEQDGYAHGYNDGQAACPTCPQGELYNVELDSGWTGYSDILLGELANEITITDNGYSEAKYNEGYTQGYSNGYSDGASDCSAAIEQAYDSGYTVGFTAGEGEIHTLEIVIKTENNYYEAFTGDTRITMVLDEGEGVPAHTTPYDPANIIEGDGIDEYMGTYYFNTQDSDDPSLYYISQIYDTTAKTLTLCFKGYLYNNSGVYPQPIYGCPSALGVEIMASNINNWGNWSVETVRFNGRPLYDNHGWLSKIGNGGFKLKPTYYEDNPAVLNNHRQIFIITY